MSVLMNESRVGCDEPIVRQMFFCASLPEPCNYSTLNCRTRLPRLIYNGTPGLRGIKMRTDKITNFKETYTPDQIMIVSEKLKENWNLSPQNLITELRR